MTAVSLFSDNAFTVISSGGNTSPIGGTVETWTASSPSLFPTASNSATPPTQFWLFDPNQPTEWMLVTNTAGGTWTVTRGADGSTPVAHGTSFTVYCVATAGALASMLQGANNLADVASTTAARTNLGLGSAAVQASTAFDPSGAAATAQSNAVAASLPITGGTLTGTLIGVKSIVAGVVTLTYSSTLSVNASLGNHYRVTLTGNAALAAPTSASDGQKITFEVIQDATGGRLLTYASAYAFGAAGAPTLSTGANKRDILGFVYSSSAGEWLYAGSALGF